MVRTYHLLWGYPSWSVWLALNFFKGVFYISITIYIYIYIFPITFHANCNCHFFDYLMAVTVLLSYWRPNRFTDITLKNPRYFFLSCGVLLIFYQYENWATFLRKLCRSSKLSLVLNLKWNPNSIAILIQTREFSSLLQTIIQTSQ